MNLRSLSAVVVVIFALFSASAYGLAQYNFPAAGNFSHVWNSRASVGCPTGVGGTAVYPNHALTGEILCNAEARRQGINENYMRWYASPVFGTWDSPGDNKLCKGVGNRIDIVGGNSSGGQWTNIVVCKYEPFDCGDRWRYQLQRAGLDWQLNWTKTNAAREYANVGGVQFKCMPRECTTGICRGTPDNLVDECFLTRDGTYKRLNGAECPFCPAGTGRVNTGGGDFQCVPDKCNNIGGAQTAVPAGTTRNATGACTCNNGGGNPPTCTLPTTPPASVACNDGIDNDSDGKTDYPSDPGCTSATDTTEQDATACSTTPEVVSTYFGGMYGGPSYNNPTTNAQSCPTGYVATRVSGTGNVDWVLFVCTRAVSSTTPAPTEYFEFGGMWGTGGDMPSPLVRHVNPYTGANSCPAGFTQTQVLGVQNVDWTLYYCWKSLGTTIPTKDFGGMWGINGTSPAPSNGVPYNNPVTNSASCPTGFTPRVAWGTTNIDWLFQWCYRAPTTAGSCAQCADGIDNDGDGKIDFGGANADPDCSSATDNTESGTLVCPAGETRRPTPESPVCLLVATPKSATSTIPTTFDFKTAFPGISYTPTNGDADDIKSLIEASPASGLGNLTSFSAQYFRNDQATANKVCNILGYQTAQIVKVQAAQHAATSYAAWVNNTWERKQNISEGAIEELRCSSPMSTTGGSGTNFTLTGYEHLTGNCTLAGMTTHDTPPKTISPLVSLGLSVSPTISNISAVTDSTFLDPAQVRSLLTCPVAGNSACSIGAGGVITCGCYNAGITPPVTTTSTTTIPATYDFSVNFPGVNYNITERDGDRSFSRDIVGVVNAHSPSLGLSDPTDTVSFYNAQATANQACRVLGYQTAEIYSRNSFDGTGGRKVAVYENNAWVLKSLSGNNDVINGLRCSSPLPAGTTTGSAVTPPVYTCVANRCTEGQYYCAAENACKPANQPCSSITCNKNNICDADESCDCSDCTIGVPDNDKDRCGISGGQQLYCTKDSATNENIRFPFCLPACLDGQACTTTCNTQVGACCPAGSTWNSVADSCVPATCGKGQFYCAAQQKCLPGGTTCDTTVCVNDGVCSGEESCQCADCVDGGTDDKDKCSVIGGLQAVCSDDNLTDGLPGACCVPPEKWDTATKTCKACSNTQAPAQVKANYDQPYIACTGDGTVTNTHFRYKLTKQGSTDTPFVSDIFANSTQVLHPKLPIGMYTVECFYGTSSSVDVGSTATPHSCVKTIESKDVNLNAVNGCSRIYGYKGSTLSDEMTSNSPFSATFRCGSRMDTKASEPNPFSLRVGTNTPITLGYDLITELFAEFGLGISQASTAQNFATGSTPVACAVMVGGGYSTNDYCRLTACVGDNCNVPKAFSVVHSNDLICTTEETAEYSIGCNPDAPTEVLNACVAMFDEAVRNIVPAPAPGVSFPVKMHINGSIPNNGAGVECVKYGPGQMPHAQNIYGTVSCTALLPNGEFYEIYASDSGGNPISSLQSKGRTVERDDIPPTISEVKYYTDASLTQEVAMTKWYNKPVYAAVVCSDKPLGESLSCACSPKVNPALTTNPEAWNDGVQFGGVDVGADILRYVRMIPASITTPQSVGVIDTAGKPSDKKDFTISIDTEAPKMEIGVPSGSGSVKTITLTATDTVSKIWKNTLAPTSPTATNTAGILYRKDLRANLDSLTFDEQCDMGASDAFFATINETGLQTTATVTIPDVNTTTDVVTYCIRDNAGNTTRGIYPVITDACFSASNMPAPVPNLDNYKGFTSARLGSTTFTANQKYGYSFSENTTNAACFRGILATNIQTLVTNQLEPRTSTTLTNWTSDLAPTKANTSVLNTNGYYYYRYTTSSGNILSLTTSPTGTGTKSVIVEGGDIQIRANMTAGPGQSLILIARKNSSGNGGNIIIDPTVTNIDAVLIADGGAVKSSDSTTPGERLTINGRIYSYNTRGGSLKPSGATDVMNSDTPKVFNQSGALVNATDFFESQKQDLERLRPIFADSDTTCSLRLNYYAYTTSTLPVLLQRPVGYTGGNCTF